MRFEEVLPALREGKSVRRRSSPTGITIKRANYPIHGIVQGEDWQLTLEYILSTDDWEIVEETPLPCPFCGSNQVDLRYNGEKHFFIACLSCKAEGPITNFRTSAKEYWNKAKR